MTTLRVDQIVEAAENRLLALGSPEIAKSMERFFKHEIQALGIKIPQLRRLAKEICPKPAEQSADIVLAACDQLLQSEYHEIRLFGLILLSRCKRILGIEVFACAEEWLVGGVNTWALVDEFCGGTLYYKLRAEPSALQYLQRWNNMKPMWLRRASVVVLVKFARKGEYLDEAYQLANNLADAPEDLIHKASGWLLREAGATDPKRLRNYLVAKGFSMSRTSVRYAIEHFEENERQELLQLTKQKNR